MYRIVSQNYNVATGENDQNSKYPDEQALELLHVDVFGVVKTLGFRAIDQCYSRLKQRNIGPFHGHILLSVFAKYRRGSKKKNLIFHLPSIIAL